MRIGAVAMRAAVFDGGSLAVREVDLDDEPGHGEIVVRVHACGVCHSDLSGIDGTFPVPTPIVLGHEAAGVVERVGPGVERLVVGDRVVLTPAPPCGRCYGCVRGEPGICVNTRSVMSFALPDGTTRLTQGGEVVHRGLGLAGFAEQVVTLETGAVVVPDDVPLDVACVIGCGVQTGVGAVLNTAQVEEGATVVVVGLGGVGLSVVQGARIAGATRIIAVDPVVERRTAAEQFGATDTIDPTRADVVSAAYDLTDGVGVDYAFEVVGRSALIQTCIAATRPGGATVMVGAPPLDDPLVIDAPVLFGAMEKKLLGCFLGSSNALRDIPRYLAMAQAGLLDLDSMVTAHRPLDEIEGAFDDLRNQRGIRTVVQCSPV